MPQAVPRDTVVSGGGAVVGGGGAVAGGGAVKGGCVTGGCVTGGAVTDGCVSGGAVTIGAVVAGSAGAWVATGAAVVAEPPPEPLPDAFGAAVVGIATGAGVVAAPGTVVGARVATVAAGALVELDVAIVVAMVVGGTVAAVG